MNQEQLLNLLEKYEELKRSSPLEFMDFYKWQLDAINFTKDFREILLLAGNRCGKTLTANSFLSYNLTGEYPEWYDGIRFDFPIKVMACGISGDQIKDVLQKILIGDVEHDKSLSGGGLIATNRVTDIVFDRSVKGLIRECRIVHKKGYKSILKFRSYSQGPAVLRGSYWDIILCDEEPEPDGIVFYAEMLARILLGNKRKGGRLILSFTPEKGFTELVDKIWNHTLPTQKLINVGWDDCPHITESVKNDIIKSIPSYLIPAKTKGIPTLEGGKVFRVPESEIMCDPFEIPPHYYLLCAVDLGYVHEFVACFCALDRDRDIIFIWDIFAQKNHVPLQHINRINWIVNKIPIVFPHDVNTREKSGNLVRNLYIEAGANFAGIFQNEDGTNHIEPGLLKLNSWFETGKIKVFKNCEIFFHAYRKFRRNEKNGKLVEDEKDVIDAFRYCALSVHAKGVQKKNVGILPFKRTFPKIYP